MGLKCIHPKTKPKHGTQVHTPSNQAQTQVIFSVHLTTKIDWECFCVHDTNGDQ